MLSIKAELLCMYNMHSCGFKNIILLCESVKLLLIDYDWIFRLVRFDVLFNHIILFLSFVRLPCQNNLVYINNNLLNCNKYVTMK